MPQTVADTRSALRYLGATRPRERSRNSAVKSIDAMTKDIRLYTVENCPALRDGMLMPEEAEIMGAPA
jgi:hypothetical protein